MEAVKVSATAEAIAEARRLIDRLEAEVAGAEAEYARDHGYEIDGFGSMAAFLRFR